jgi:hypothetical protein
MTTTNPLPHLLTIVDGPRFGAADLCTSKHAGALEASFIAIAWAH